MRKVWKLPNLTHCNVLPLITNCLPLNIILEKTPKIDWEYY